MCDCDDDDGGAVFLVATLGKFNNDSFIGGSIASSGVGGFVRFGQNAFMADDASVVADKVKIGALSSVFDVQTNNLLTTTGSNIRGTLTDTLAVPLDASNLLRWVSPRTIKETLNPPVEYRYPFMGAE